MKSEKLHAKNCHTRKMKKTLIRNGNAVLIFLPFSDVAPGPT